MRMTKKKFINDEQKETRYEKMAEQTAQLKKFLEKFNELSIEQKAAFMSRAEKELPGTFPPRHILSDASWFARAETTTAVKLKPNMGIEEYLVKTRIAPMVKAMGGDTGYDEDDEDGIPYPHDEEIKVPFDKIRLQLQVDRYSTLEYQEHEFTPQNPGVLTAGEIFQWVYDFYHNPIKGQLVEDIAGTDDGWGYSETAQAAIDEGRWLELQEVMGDCMHFEGLRYITTERGDDTMTGVYLVCFGS